MRDRVLETGTARAASTISRSMVQKVMGKRVYASKPKIRVRLRRPHNRNKKWRIEVIDTGKSVEFGQAGASDFTIHGEPARMVRYLVRHAGNVPDSLKQTGGTEKNIVRRALDVDTSRREHWGGDNLSRAQWRAPASGAAGCSGLSRTCRRPSATLKTGSASSLCERHCRISVGMVGLV